MKIILIILIPLILLSCSKNNLENNIQENFESVGELKKYKVKTILELGCGTGLYLFPLKAAGFDIVDGDSAIVPVMLYDAKLSQIMATLY